MTRLPVDHPSVFEHFQNGGFQSKLVTTTLSVESLLIRPQRRQSTRINRLLEAPRDSDCWRHQGVNTAGGTKGVQTAGGIKGVQTAGGTKGFRLLEAPRGFRLLEAPRG